MAVGASSKARFCPLVIGFSQRVYIFHGNENPSNGRNSWDFSSRGMRGTDEKDVAARIVSVERRPPRCEYSRTKDEKAARKIVCSLEFRLTDWHKNLARARARLLSLFPIAATFSFPYIPGRVERVAVAASPLCSCEQRTLPRILPSRDLWRILR